MNALKRLWNTFFERAGSSLNHRYRIRINRGRSALNDEIFDFLAPRITGPWLDIGTNVGVLLKEVPQGTGVDASDELVRHCQNQGLNVLHASACKLPFESNRFETVVLSCVLEQVPEWETALQEAVRVCKSGGKVIGFNPIPHASEWGRPGRWVKSVITEDAMKAHHAKIDYPLQGKYFFEITKAS